MSISFSPTDLYGKFCNDILKEFEEKTPLLEWFHKFRDTLGCEKIHQEVKFLLDYIEDKF